MTLKRSAAGVRMGDMRALQDCAAGMTSKDVSASLTAKAGGGQATATQLVNGLNLIGVCATNADSVQLPAAIAGSIVYVANAGAADATVYGKYGRTDTINTTAGATGVTQADPLNAIYFCVVTGAWRRVLSA